MSLEKSMYRQRTVLSSIGGNSGRSVLNTRHPFDFEGDQTVRMRSMEGAPERPPSIPLAGAIMPTPRTSRERSVPYPDRWPPGSEGAAFMDRRQSGAYWCDHSGCPGTTVVSCVQVWRFVLYPTTLGLESAVS